MWNEDPSRHETRGTEITGDDPPRVDPNASRAPEAAFESRYVPKVLLGRGGMGEVFLCRDTVIGRDVALKLMRAKNREHIDSHGRFLREASIQGQLEHPAIVPIYDMGSAETTGIFFTMKRIRGNTLRDVLEKLKSGDEETKQKYSRAKLLAAFQQLCLAADFAHSRGVVHRDLKPANVMLGDFGEVYVLDWGIAKIVEEQQGKEDALESPPSPPTLEGAIVGTPGYMAPEQRYGETVKVTAQTDVYALGIVLHEMLTLEGPRSVSQLEVSDKIPPELAVIVARATKFTPAQRYSSARDMAEAIARFLDGDRDLELRRELGRKQASVAQTAVAEVKAGRNEDDDAARAAAMREVSRALAFDAENVDARRALVELMLHRPKKLPKEVLLEQERIDGATRASSLKNAIVGIVSLAALLPIVLWSGVRDQTLLWVAGALWIGLLTMWIAGVKAAQGQVGPPRWGRISTVNLVFVLFMILSRLFGPLILVPSLIGSVLPSLTFNLNPREGRWLFISAQLVYLAPLLLELAGVLPVSYSFADGAMTIKPQLAYLREGPVIFGLTFAALATMFVPVILLRRVRRVLDEATNERLMQAWYLRHLVEEPKN